MTAYTIQQLEALAAQRGSIDTSRNRSDVETFRPPPVPRDVRADIYSFVYGAGRAVSRAEIAEALSLKKTPWIIAHIERLRDEGYLTRLESVAPNGIAPMFFYSISSTI